MDDEVESQVFELQPARYDAMDFVGMGFHFASDILDRTSELFTALTIMTAQSQIQKRIDRKFKEIISGS